MPFALNGRISDGSFHDAPIDGPEALPPDGLMSESFKDFGGDPGERGSCIDDEFELLRPEAIRRGDSDFRHDDSHRLSMHRVHDSACSYKYVTRPRPGAFPILANGRDMPIWRNTGFGMEPQSRTSRPGVPSTDWGLFLIVGIFITLIAVVAFYAAAVNRQVTNVAPACGMFFGLGLLLVGVAFALLSKKTAKTG